MNSDLSAPIIDWEAAGYFGWPQEAVQNRDSLSQFPESYRRWLVVFQQATQGEFERLPSLIEEYKQSSQDYIFGYHCAALLGDAGTSFCFKKITENIIAEKTGRYELIIDFCGVLFERGRLADIPLMLAAYEKHSSIDEVGIIPCLISEILEYPVGDLTDPLNYTSEAEYHDAVLERYQNLVGELGDDQVLIFGGKPFGVVPFAEMLLDRFQHPHVQTFWRRKFEASTGINCTDFYRDQSFQPLAATAIVEDFLESPEAARYEDGVRYFFGHCIPD